MANKKTQLNIDCSYDKLVPVKDLRPNPGNPNKHTQQQIELLAAIIKATKWRYPITVSKQSGMIVTGHCRYEASKHLGLDAVPVSFQSFDSNADELAELARENKIREYAEIDGQMMADLLVELDQANYDLNLVAMTPDEIQDYVLGPLEPNPEDDIIPDPPKKAKTKMGDLIILGNHRLLCGDATKAEDVGRLMGRAKADMVFADPPFPNNSGIMEKQIIGIDNAFVNARHFCKGIMYWFWDNIGEPPFNEKIVARHCWHKTNGWQAGHWEAINEYDATKDRKECLVYSFANVGGENIRETQGNHQTPKPIGLCREFIGRVRRNNIVLDTFLGSGSTLIACEKLNRRCYGMEIDPIYCDVIVERWEKFTGKKAKRQKAAA